MEDAAASDDEVRVINQADSKLTHVRRGQHHILRLEGFFDVYSAPTLREVMWPLAENAQGNLIVVVNSGTMELFDSTSLGVLIGALKRIRVSGHAIQVVDAPNGKLRKIFRITGLTHVIPVHERLEDALAAASKHDQTG